MPPPCSFSINLIILNPLGNINARLTLLYRYTRLAPPTQSAKKLLHMISSISPQYLITFPILHVPESEDDGLLAREKVYGQG